MLHIVSYILVLTLHSLFEFEDSIKVGMYVFSGI